MFNQVARKTVMMASTVAMLAGCSKGTGGYSLLNDNSDYKQQAVIIPKKIDILWVIDNSGSMRSSQTNLTNNFSSFINRFKEKNFDFHMAVTATDGWKKRFNAASPLARIRDGGRILNADGSIKEDTHSGVFVMTKDTPNLTNVFTTNATQGTAGAGDERAFESFKQSLLDPFNANFRRPEAFLAIIIVSDEEDFSHDTASQNESYSNPGLQTVESFKDFLDGFTEISTYGKNYSVSTITVDSQACLNSLDNNAQKLAPRVEKLADLTGGTKGSICGNFGQTLELISDSIINLSSVFKLTREPQVDTISVTVDGVVVPMDVNNGWSYNATDWTITFHGSAVPAANANIKIDFYPKSIQL
ncbi:hypothetical protein AZI86_12335 [Bdellovibrio bacteriovorus]|uniref:VWFA domain-containing protein n=1 Tax=Bdellovibrio bacteriovorus TaxID=959 RepID=A0A150WMC3_BDEBC|nr:hypothetical protein [Bdellovibrio bacteriovorus]KYG64975.1 hypothetical protein AZI86_12335 [Bdellovibrio bacteriovorus]